MTERSAAVEAAREVVDDAYGALDHAYSQPGSMRTQPQVDRDIEDARIAVDAALDAFEAACTADARALADQLAEALELAHPALCSMHCPSVKKTDAEWRHTQECRDTSAAMTAYNERRAQRELRCAQDGALGVG